MVDHKPVIECASLNKIFKDFWGRNKVRAVIDLDFEVRPGEVFGLLGPNGSGKSTTIKILLGLLYPTTGRARIFDRPPTDTAVKSRIGFMPEESYLYRYLNPRETLDFYGKLFNLPRDERKRRTEQLIEMVGLKQAARRSVGQFSKGMARRIGLAQALINDPDLLILDEPTTGLDPIGSRQIKDVIVELKKRGKTVLLSSHLLADVEDVCDRVAILYGGRMRAYGTVDELLSHHDVTQINADTLDDATIAEVRRVIESRGGKKVHSVKHPTDRLEDFFLKVVSTAQRERLETSGAESGRGVTEFLSARPEEGRAVVDNLVQSGTPKAPAAETEKPASKAPAADRAKLDKLMSEPDAAKAGGPEAAAEAPKPKTDRSVLDRLVSTDDKDDKPDAK